ncbi:hypothetical protein B0H19DRAFT_1067725 [Mycena capillaripes]|nr:hypothetical protein B0H19DRAFT_1067725 [Mycena capillaripes]
MAAGWNGHAYYVRWPAGTGPATSWILAERANGSIVDPAFLETSQAAHLGLRSPPPARRSSNDASGGDGGRFVPGSGTDAIINLALNVVNNLGGECVDGLEKYERLGEVWSREY